MINQSILKNIKEAWRKEEFEEPTHCVGIREIGGLPSPIWYCCVHKCMFESIEEFVFHCTCERHHNKKMNVSLKGRGEVLCSNSSSVVAPLQTTLF